MMNVIKAMEETVQLAFDKPQMPHDGTTGSTHLVTMLDVMRDGAFSYGKQCRWLGWAQASVVAHGAATLDDMKQINKRYKI